MPAAAAFEPGLGYHSRSRTTGFAHTIMAIRCKPDRREVGDHVWRDVRVPGKPNEMNLVLEKATRVADFLEFGELLCLDALERKESCGGHFRTEYQDEEGEAKRDDEHFAHVAAWEWTGDPMKAIRNVEELEFEAVHLATRSYK